MTSAERALRLVRERRFHKLDMDAVRALSKHADAANLSVGDLDEAMWLSRAIDAPVAEALAVRWVPVGERLPEMMQPVIVTAADVPLLQTSHGPIVLLAQRMPCDGCDEAWHWHHAASLGMTYGVIAWQPLPAAWVAP